MGKFDAIITILRVSRNRNVRNLKLLRSGKIVAVHEMEGGDIKRELQSDMETEIQELDEIIASLEKHNEAQ
jgi:hypothetical protein